MIILVEDDPDQRLMLRIALEQAGYAVREARNGREALALQREHAAAFVITDLFMPDSDGFELADAIRKEFPATKIIVVSGGTKGSRHDYLAAARLIGVDATLKKPFEMPVLLRTLEALRD